MMRKRGIPDEATIDDTARRVAQRLDRILMALPDGHPYAMHPKTKRALRRKGDAA